MRAFGHILAAALICGVVWTVGPTAVFADDDTPAMAGLTGGDAPWEQAFDEAMLDGRDAYNDGDWEGAIRAFTAAIQAMPENPAGYRNLARSYNLDGQLNRATAYYDDYLELAGDADDADDIRDERRGAIARGGDDPWTVPASQRMARRTLERELDAGRAVNERGGGALQMYRRLLDQGYVRPDLDRLRQRLVRALADESSQQFEPVDGFIPLLDEETRELQRQRLTALGEQTRSDDELRWARQGERLLEAVQALEDGDYDTVVELIEQMVDDGVDDRFGYVAWYRVVALKERGDYDEALEALDELHDRGLFADRGQRRLEVMRAVLLQRVGREGESAAVLQQVLAR